MKTFELTMKLKNNLIKRRRLDLGLSCREAATAAGVNYGLWLNYEAMTLSPLSPARNRNRKQRWRPSALSVAAFFGILPEELFPEAVLLVVAPEQVREIDADEVRALSEMKRELNALPPVQPDEQFDAEQVKALLRGALEQLKPRERKVIELRFGEDLTFDEIGKTLRVSVERVRQIHNVAMRKLKAPHRVVNLEEFRP